MKETQKKKKKKKEQKEHTNYYNELVPRAMHGLFLKMTRQRIIIIIIISRCINNQKKKKKTLYRDHLQQHTCSNIFPCPYLCIPKITLFKILSKRKV
jgi:hypothetical protein